MKVLQILSGGMDSSTLALWHLARGDEISALSFHYGQRHSGELVAARQLCDMYGIPWDMIQISGFAQLIPGCSLTDMGTDTPHGHYAAENMKATVVPSRNAIMLSMAFGVAVANGFDAISFGAHSGDHTIYPDCRMGFIHRMEEALNSGVWTKQGRRIEILAPFLTLSKTDIVRLGDNLNVPWAATWTCYEGGDRHCGLCGACQERKEAFSDAGVTDPTEYNTAVGV